MNRALLKTTMIMFAIVMSATDEAKACPNCKEAVAAQPSDSGNVAQGYNWSILFMMTMPFAMLGTGALLVKQAVRRGAFPEL